MIEIYDQDRMNAYLDRMKYQNVFGTITFQDPAPKCYSDRFPAMVEDDFADVFYEGHCSCRERIIRTNDGNIAFLAIYMYLMRERDFGTYPGRVSAEERARRLRFSRRASLGAVRPGTYYARRDEAGEGLWCVGYHDGEDEIPFFSGLDWETALFYLEEFVRTEPGFDRLFADLQRETGIRDLERSPLLAVYMCGRCGVQFYEEDRVLREYLPEGAGRFDFARVDSYLHNTRRLYLDSGPFGDSCTYVEKWEGRYRLCHRFDEKQNPSTVAEDPEGGRVLMAALAFKRFYTGMCPDPSAYPGFLIQFESQFQSMCEPGLLSPGDRDFVFEAAKEAYYG